MPWNAVQQKGDTSTGTSSESCNAFAAVVPTKGQKEKTYKMGGFLYSSRWLPLFSTGPYLSDLYCRLKIPRRPEWSTDMSPEILEQRERASFLEWRRDLAKYTILPHATPLYTLVLAVIPLQHCLSPVAC